MVFIAFAIAIGVLQPGQASALTRQAPAQTPSVAPGIAAPAGLAPSGTLDLQPPLRSDSGLADPQINGQGFDLPTSNLLVEPSQIQLGPESRLEPAVEVENKEAAPAPAAAKKSARRRSPETRVTIDDPGTRSDEERVSVAVSEPSRNGKARKPRSARKDLDRAVEEGGSGRVFDESLEPRSGANGRIEPGLPDYLDKLKDSVVISRDEERALAVPIQRGVQARAQLERGDLEGPRREELRSLVERGIRARGKLDRGGVLDEDELLKAERVGLLARSHLERDDLKDKTKERLRGLIKGGEAARNELVNANLRWAVKRARKYNFGGLPLDDLIQAANLGLLDGAESFDPGRGRFSTHATWQIFNYVMMALRDRFLIRLPSGVQELVTKLGKAEQAFEEEFGRAPSPEELAKKLKVKLPRLGEIVAARGMMAKGAQEADGENEEGTNMADVPAAAEEESALDLEYFEDPAMAIAGLQALERRAPREATVLKMRFGIPPYESMTLEQVGRELGLTKERIRQIETKAKEHLREEIERLASENK